VVVDPDGMADTRPTAVPDRAESERQLLVHQPKGPTLMSGMKKYLVAFSVIHPKGQFMSRAFVEYAGRWWS
jgi:hypothetical protein